MRRSCLLCLLLSLGLWGVFSGLAQPEMHPADACKTAAARKKLLCYEQRLALADRELNAVYQHLASHLASTRRQAMQAQSRQWIAYKEALCLESTGIALSLDAAQARRRPEYPNCLYDLTVSRTAYLKKAFGQEGLSPGLAGVYDDGFGGRLTLRASGSDSYTFHLEVVRGPTFHTGEVGGSLHLQANTATFVQQSECGGEVPCCRLTFERRPLFLHLAEDRCTMLHGVRAYFTGDYWKVR